MILQQHIYGKRKTLSIIGEWKESGGNETTLSIYKQGNFRLISKDGIELHGMYDISRHEQRKIDVTAKKESEEEVPTPAEKTIQDKVYTWNKITFTPGEKFSPYRIKEEYQFWFNEKGGLVLYDDKTKKTEYYDRIVSDEEEGS
jgi:hypothetical protein